MFFGNIYLWYILRGWEGCAGKQLWPVLRYYLGICLEGLKKTTDQAVIFSKSSLLSLPSHSAHCSWCLLVSILYFLYIVFHSLFCSFIMQRDSLHVITANPAEVVLISINSTTRYPRWSAVLLKEGIQTHMRFMNLSEISYAYIHPQNLRTVLWVVLSPSYLKPVTTRYSAQQYLLNICTARPSVSFIRNVCSNWPRYS
jgi:hypothetical protein